MACPICQHTMENLGSPSRRIWWCPRCGTLKEETGETGQVVLPIWLRNILESCDLAPRALGQSQCSGVRVTFIVRQVDREVPQLELQIFRPDGTRRF